MSNVVNIAKEILKKNLVENLGEEPKNIYARSGLDHKRIEGLYQEAMDIKRNWKDYNSEASDLSFQSIDNKMYLVDAVNTFLCPLTNWSLTQFATKNDSCICQ